MTIRNDTRKDDYFKSIATLAKAEGEGANSRPAFGRETFIAASDDVIKPGSGKDDVGDVVKIHEHYQRNIGKKFTGAAPLQDASSLKVQQSKLRTIISVGAHPAFRTRTDGTSPAKEFLQTFDDVLGDLQVASKRSLPVYDKLVSVCRAQRTKFKSKPDVLTRAEIAEAIAPPKAKPEELSILRRLAGSIRKLGERADMSGAAECLENAAMALSPRIQYLEELEKNEALLDQVNALPEALRAAALAAMEAAQVEAEAE
jgi:hypothetical protein